MSPEYEDINSFEKSIHPSWLNYMGQCFFSLIFLAVAIVMYIKEIEIWPIAAIAIGIIVLIRIVFQRISLTYTITKDSICSINGLIARNENEIRIKDIREVGVSQSIGQRILGIGNVYFASAGTGGVEVTFEGIGNPHGVKDRVNEIRNAPEASDKKRCPQCGEFIWIKAIVCPHCKYKFEEQ
jgi:uncharacterized membrane protein YdbT with pleckstrin-like domain